MVMVMVVILVMVVVMMMVVVVMVMLVMMIVVVMMIVMVVVIVIVMRKSECLGPCLGLYVTVTAAADVSQAYQVTRLQIASSYRRVVESNGCCG